MKKLILNLQNCYGIQNLNYTFDFNTNSGKKAYAIYAPNGIMKTSLTRTFDDLSNGCQPKEERYNRPSTCNVLADDIPIEKDMIYILKSEIDISIESTNAITNILVNPEHKANYDELLIDIEKNKVKLINQLQKVLKIKKTEIERELLKIWNCEDLPSCINNILEITISEDLSNYEYGIIFEPKAIEVFLSPEFIEKARDFNNRYQELFSEEGSIYTKGIFNPVKAEISFDTLKKQGFFDGGHLVHLRGDDRALNQIELEERHKSILDRINTDELLQKLRVNLEKNAQTQALFNLFEKLSNSEIEFLLEKMKPENQTSFRKDLIAYNIQNTNESIVYLDSFKENSDRLKMIEDAAAIVVPRWKSAIDLFNDRFVDMPFKLNLANHTEAVLGKEKPILSFLFTDDTESITLTRNELTTLSQGEKRALYLLNLIFEVESRKLSEQETLFIFDDIADSFDYKNKHAIIQYLKDLTNYEYFHQIVLTHNFDFFRSLSINLIHRDKCLMTIKNKDSINLEKAEGIKNYFIGMWKDKIDKDDTILYATIPFTRNILEYTKGETDSDYLKLTSLLHWKSDSSQIIISDYLDIYNKTFGTKYINTDNKSLIDLLIECADNICKKGAHNGMNLEDKVVLCIAIRIQAERFMLQQLQENDSDYILDDTTKNPFGKLIIDFSLIFPSSEAKRTLEKVSITVSSNIHLNSFMYEPILDLSIEHLIALYGEINSL